MKILHLVPAMEQGGVETVVCGLNRVVTQAGWRNVVVSRGGRLVKTIESDGGRHIALDLKSKNPLTYFSRARQLRKLLDAERPDLVCAHSRVPAWLFIWANRRLGLKWITYAHGANSVSRYSAVMTHGDLTVTPSRFLADFLKANYGLAEEKIRVVNPAVDARRFDPESLDAGFIEDKRREWGISPDDFVVMAVGRISPPKGLDTLIDAVSNLAVRIPEIRLVLVGDADRRHIQYLDSLKALAARKFPSTVFAGGESKIPECLSVASVLVSANTVKPESFGLSMAEALMMGKPVVAKAFGGALDVVRDGIDGILVHDGDFAKAIADVHGRTFGNLRQFALERFNTDILASRTLAAYREFAV